MTIPDAQQELVQAMVQVRELQAQLAGLQQALARVHDKLSEQEEWGVPGTMC